MGNNISGCYPKYLRVFTTYQVQGWWTNILSPVKSQPVERNVNETSEIVKQTLKNRRYNLKSETSIWKSKNNPLKGHNKSIQLVCYTFLARKKTPKGNNKKVSFSTTNL